MEAALSAVAPIEEHWTGENVSVAEIERELARLRDKTSEESAQPNLRTSVMTHIAWVPPQWKGAAEETLAGMAERHPSRTLLLIPEEELEDGLDALASIRCFPIGDRAVCGEVIELTLRGRHAFAPASIVLPLLIADLPVFCRWRGQPPFGSIEFEQMVDTVDRLIVDSAEWNELDYDDLLAVFPRTAVSDIVWARTLPWRIELAKHWPAIAEAEVRISGPRAEASLLHGWLNARLDRALRPIEEAPKLAVRVGKEELAPARGLEQTPSDLLSAQLDNFDRDPIYEEAVRAAASS